LKGQTLSSNNDCLGAATTYILQRGNMYTKNREKYLGENVQYRKRGILASQ